MIYITGDCHFDFYKFNMKNFPVQKQMKIQSENHVIITGDFGLWDQTRTTKYWLNWLENKKFTILFVDGNHENFDLLDSYPVNIWNGGKVHFIRPNIIHLMRGQVFTIEGKKIFTFGGAESHDISGGILEPDDPEFKQKKKVFDKKWISYRINRISWWKEELPSETEFQEGLLNLEKHNWSVDFVITHCCGTIVQNTFGYGLYQSNGLTDYLEEILLRLQFKKHFFGHYHDNRIIQDNYIMLYDLIQAVE